MKERTYICCDLKSFYASVECVERGLDPMTTNLVVADDRIVDKALLVRRLSISANRLLHEEKVPKQDEVEQLDLFTDYAAKEKQKAENAAEHARERKIQETILGIKKKFGKNAILKGLNLEDGATARERNQTIGGHQA